MRILVTAGNTFTPIDRVRGITNIFTGRTGANIAQAADTAGHDVSLITSHPELATLSTVVRYQTFEELEALLADKVATGKFDAIIHAAAVNDYHVAGVYDANRRLIDATGKVKSNEPELWMQLVRALKLIDRMRTDWKFKGVLVKFKLEVGIDEAALLMIAEASRQQSDADLMVANTLEGAAEWAYIGPLAGRYERATRAQLPAMLLNAIAEIKRG